MSEIILGEDLNYVKGCVYSNYGIFNRTGGMMIKHLEDNRDCFPAIDEKLKDKIYINVTDHIHEKDIGDELEFCIDIEDMFNADMEEREIEPERALFWAGKLITISSKLEKYYEENKP